MASRFHTGVDYWLSLPLDELLRWVEVGDLVVPTDRGEQ